MAVRIVTDSSCDLTAAQAGELGIEIVPLSIRFGDDEFTDGVDLTIEDFYRRMETSSQLPETAAPAPGAFEAAFRRAAAASGGDAVLCLTISSDLSATFQSAQNAARAVEGEIDVRVVDSRSITAGLGSQLLVAGRAAADGRTIDEVVALVESMSSRTRVYGALDTLENLKKGGRIGGAQALLGNLLSIKPIVDISSGKVEEAGKARTRKKALQELADKVLEEPTVEELCVYHGMAPDLDELLALLQPRYDRTAIRTGLIGPVIGAHGGPRVMGVTFQIPG